MTNNVLKIPLMSCILACTLASTALASDMLACDFKLHQRYVNLGPERDQLSKEYIQKHYGFKPESLSIDPRLVVIHWTGIESLQASFNVFNNMRLPGYRKELINASALNVGVHFLVAKNGDVYQLLPLPYFARHVIGLNYSAIGVENVGGTNGRLTPEQLDSNNRLVRCLLKTYPEVKYVIGHYEYRAFEATPLFLEKDPSYRTVKTDPGVEFMSELRVRLKDLVRNSRLCDIASIKEGKCPEI